MFLFVPIYSIDPKGINVTGNITIIIPCTSMCPPHRKNYTRWL